MFSIGQTSTVLIKYVGGEASTATSAKTTNPVSRLKDPTQLASNQRLGSNHCTLGVPPPVRRERDAQDEEKHIILTWMYIIDIPWIDNTHVSLSCEWEKSECVFQFWKDSEEQFYCELSECTQTSKYMVRQGVVGAAHLTYRIPHSFRGQ